MATREQAAEPGLALANQILACESFEALAGELMPRLTAFFGAGSSCAFEMHRSGGRLSLGRATQIHMPIRAIADYSAHFVGLDPVCAPSFGERDPRALAPNVHKVVRLSDRCARGALLDSSYYNEFLREIDVQHVFGLMVRPEFDPTRVVVLGFHRPRSERDFSFELEQAAALAPAFHASVERMCYRARMEREAPAGSRSGVRELVLRFGPDARLLDLADAPEPAAARPASTSLYFPMLMDALAQGPGEQAIDARWSAMLSDLGVRGTAPGARMRVTRGPSAHEFRLRLVPPVSVPVVDRWAQGLRLTPRELEVTRHVAGGLRNLDVARELDLSLRTVENHLRSIFAKAGVRSRTQLLSRLVECDGGRYPDASRT